MMNPKTDGNENLNFDPIDPNEDQDGSDLTGERLYGDWRFTRYDPYGFWKVKHITKPNMDIGETLRGQFTTAENARQAVDAWEAARSLEAEQVRQQQKALERKKAQEAAEMDAKYKEIKAQVEAINAAEAVQPKKPGRPKKV